MQLANGRQHYNKYTKIPKKCRWGDQKKLIACYKFSQSVRRTEAISQQIVNSKFQQPANKGAVSWPKRPGHISTKSQRLTQSVG